MKKLLSICCAVLFALPLLAQQQYKGVVTDSNGNPFPGAVIQVAETNASAVSGVDGSYSITAKEGQTLTFTCLGMESTTVTVPANGPINVSLTESTEYIDEVVVVGYGVTKKRDLAGSVSSIKAEDVRAGVVTNSADLLKGRAAGVYVHQNTNEPGGSVNIRVRGAASIGSSNEPLYVIDGVLSSYSNNLAPEDIESIEILKDAASTAIYGANGANGVVIITTKKGHSDRFSVNYAYNLAVKNMYNPFDLADAQDQVKFEMKQWEDGGKIGTAPYTQEQLDSYKGPGTDWFKEVGQTGLTQTHAVTMQGGTEKVLAAATINYLDNKGTLPGSSFNRLNSRVNVDFKPVNWLKAGLNANVVSSKQLSMPMNTNTADKNILYQLFVLSPLSKNDDSGVNWMGKSEKRVGIMDFINNNDNQTNSRQATVSAYAEATIAKKLSIRGQYSYNLANDQMQVYYNRGTVTGGGKNGVASSIAEFTHYQQTDGLLTYHDNFAGKHDLKVIAGTSFRTNLYEYMEMDASNFSTDAFRYYNMGAANVVDGIATAREDKTNLSFFGRIEYVLLDRYIFNASFRADGASNFGKNKKWGYFPGVSAAWQLGDEHWMNWAKPVLSSFKIRASWGQTGNDGIGNYLSLKTFTTGKAYVGLENIATALYLNNPGNTDLQWETTTQTDVGFDASLWKGKVELTFDWYKKSTTNLLNPVLISLANLGIGSTTGNNGQVSNQGVELFLKWHVIDRKIFNWDTNLAFSYNKSRIDSINQEQYINIRPQGDYEYKDYIKLAEGYPMSAIYGYRYEGILQKGETYSAQPSSAAGDPKFADLDGDGVITSNDREVLGVGVPPVTIGWGNNFRLGNFDMTIFFDGSFGGSLFNLSRVILEDHDRLRYSLDKWTLNNPSTVRGRDNWQKTTSYQYGDYVNSNYVEDASFFRLSNLEIGYNIPVEKLKIQKVVKGARVFIGGQRLFTITKYSGFDPEVSSYGKSDIAQGLDFAAYPSYRTFNFGVNVTF